MKMTFKMPRYFIPLVLLFLFSTNVLSQPITVSGTVTGSGYEQGIPGVSVSVKGTTRGTITDIDGKYNIQASPGDVLIASYVGLRTKEVVVDDNTTIDIYLEEDLVGLEEVVVIGYGTIKKSDLTGSVASISTEELNKTPTTDVAEMLRGRVAGLEVTTETARPGGSSNILIRGRNSLSGSNNPLFIVDGAPSTGINDLNAMDIASIEVLKDASAQAVYGARASNGVILITTKRGSEGKINVSYSSYIGTQQSVRNFDLYTADEWLEMRRQAIRSDLAPMLDTMESWRDLLADNIILDSKMHQSLQDSAYVNWEEMVLRNALMHKHDLSITGGTDKSRFAASFGYFDQDGIVPTSGFKRGTFRLNFDQKVNKWFSFGANSFIGRSVQKVETEDRNFIIQPPLAQPYDEDGNLQMDITNDVKHYNPLMNLYESEDRRTRTNLNLTLFADFQITKNLKYRLNTNINSVNTESVEYLSTRHSIGRRLAEGSGKGGEAQIGSYNRFEYLVENILDYHIELDGTHSIYATLMQGVNEINSRNYSITAQNFTDDILGYNGIGNASIILPVSNNAFRRALISYMARFQYGYRSKYMITLTGRMDGSSVFGPNNKYAFFPSVAVAWRVDQEDFMTNFAAINNLKLRLSHGVIGNEAITPYTTLGLTENRSYTFNESDIVVGYLPGSNDFPNFDLRWESSATTNLGLDLSVYRGRINATVDAYQVNTYDLLVTRQVPQSTGFNRIWDNLGQTRNTGVEAVLGTHIVSRKDFNWMVNLTYSMNRNKILAISGKLDEEGNPVDDESNRWFIGYPINVYYDYQFEGIWQTDDDIANSHQPLAKPGHVRVADINGDTLLTPGEDRVIMSRDPKWIGSIGTSFKYKGFEISGDVYIVQGVVRQNPYLYNFNYGGLVGHFNGVRQDYWTPENPSNSVPRVYLDGTTSLHKGTFAYQNASYIRLRNLTLSYTFPGKIVEPAKISSLRIYITSNNLLTFTDYQSYSPEVTLNGYPDNRTFIAGVNVTF